MRKKILFILLVLIATASSSAQVLYIMKTSHGGCSNYSIPEIYYGGAMTSFEYNISSNEGTWLCPIKEINEYLIFDKKPAFYTLLLENYEERNQIDIKETWSFLFKEIVANCENAVGWSKQNNVPYPLVTPYFELINNQVLTSPGVNNVLTDKVKLKATGCTGTQRFHWEYKLNGGQFQKMNISTSFNEEFEFITVNFIPLDYSGFVDFRVVIDSDPSITEENVYSNIISYSVTRKSPKITQISSPNYTNCSYSNDGAVTFTFERELQDGEQYEMTLMFENGAAVPNGNKTIPKDSMTTPTTYTWVNLPAEKYILTYQTKKTIGNSEFMSAPEQKNFTISSTPKLEFTVSANNPLCNNDKVEIVISVTGGTGAYKFYLDNIEKFPPKEADGYYHLKNLTPKAYSIKVTDANNCIDTNAND